jgi:hypothetical protein
MTQQETTTVRRTHGRRTRIRRRRRRWDIMAVIAIGGALGATVRQLISESVP